MERRTERLSGKKDGKDRMKERERKTRGELI